MTASIIDFRSDTVTRPTPEMRRVMAEAAVGDDVKGDDPTVNALEAEMAARMGMEAGVFVASGAQGNLCAILTHCARGEEILVGDRYHIWKYEAGGYSVLGGVAGQPLTTTDLGGVSAASVTAAIKPDDSHFPMTRLLCLENAVDGAALSPEELEAPARAARAAGLSVHLDGARIFNAAVALKTAPTAFTSCADSVSVCLSKGLGAPLGTVLCGEAGFVARARRLRKMLGGGMRQVGIVAAAGLYALEHHVERLEDDHRRAGALLEGLSGLPGLQVAPLLGGDATRATNMVYLTFDPKLEPDLRAALAKKHVVISESAGTLRLALHLDIDDAGVERAIDAFRGFFLSNSA